MLSKSLLKFGKFSLLYCNPMIFFLLNRLGKLVEIQYFFCPAFPSLRKTGHYNYD